jgi:hypothetical protein
LLFKYYTINISPRADPTNSPLLYMTSSILKFSIHKRLECRHISYLRCT